MVWKSCFCDIKQNLTISKSRLTLSNTHSFNQMMPFNLQELIKLDTTSCQATDALRFIDSYSTVII